MGLIIDGGHPNYTTSSKGKIKIITNESDDWKILQHDNFETSGHSLGILEFKELLEHLGYDVEMEEITDEEMENMC